MGSRSKPRFSSSKASEAATEAQRLQKVLAAAGISSRRECEELIREGRVEVDRHVVSELGRRVDPARQEIRVDGVVLQRPTLVYYVLNKPAGVVSTNRDPSGRSRVIDLIPSEQRLFPVGRLDRGSEGLILVTNDGDLANRLTHPRYGVEKTYAVRVAGSLTPETMQQLRKGVYLAEGPAKVTSVRVRRRHKQCTDLEIVLNEGRNREIRRILARVGHKVLKLTRIAMGTLRLGDLPVGAHRRLTPQEVRSLQDCTRSDRGADGDAPRSRGSRRQLKKPKPPAKSTKSAKSTGSPRPTKANAGGRPKTRGDAPRKGSILAYDDPPAGTETEEGRSQRRGGNKKGPPQKRRRNREA
ncbi:MAG: rRNA pseudouridine synthase [Planctomycetes bacterium]|nr:rRNA pseudouridine synthase [Planctomycetota bacterium]